MRILIVTLVAAAALVGSVPAAACGVIAPVTDIPREDAATLRAQAARLDAAAAGEEATARALETQRDTFLARARQLDAAAQQRQEPDRTALIEQALRLEDLAAQAQARATQMRASASMQRRQALALRQRAANLAAGGGTRWRKLPPPTA